MPVFLKLKRKKFQTFITKYFEKRAQLVSAFVLVDIRHEPQKIDLDFMNWLGEKGLPFSIIFTKADKLKPNVIAQNIELYQSKMLEYWEEMPQYFVTSSSKKALGKEELLSFIEQTNSEIEALRKKS